MYINKRGNKLKKIITIQHTQAEHHVKKMIGGDTDWPLTQLGKEQANNIGKHIKELLDFKCKSIIYSSDLLRTKQTAEIVNQYLELNIIYKQELREIKMGEAKGKSKEWYKQNCASNDNIPLIDYRPFPGAENYKELYNRLFPVIEEIIKIDYENIIVVGHGGTLVMFFLQWLKLPVEFMEKIPWASSGSVSFYSISDNIRMLNNWNINSYKQ